MGLCNSKYFPAITKIVNTYLCSDQCPSNVLFHSQDKDLEEV